MADAGLTRTRILHTGPVCPESTRLVFLLFNDSGCHSALVPLSSHLRCSSLCMGHLVPDDVPDKARQLTGDRHAHQLGVLTGFRQRAVASA